MQIQWILMCGKTSLLPGNLLLCICMRIQWNFHSIFCLEHCETTWSIFWFCRCFMVPRTYTQDVLLYTGSNTWQAAHTARLKHFNVVPYDTCVLCNSETETTSHLYFSCPYTSYTWILCKLKLGKNSPSKTLSEEAASIKLIFVWIGSMWSCMASMARKE